MSTLINVEQRLLNRTTEDLHVSSPWVDTPCWICSCKQPRVDGKKEYASRIAFWLWITSIPYGLLVLHFCDNPRCVNPEHLWLGTDADNMEDKVDKERQARGDTHSSRTHPEKVPRGDTHGSRTHPESRPRGELCSWAKLTEQDVRDIRSYKEQGCRKKDVASFMKLRKSTVAGVWNGRRWKHVL